MTQPILWDEFLLSQPKAETLASHIADILKEGDIVALWGDLGAGKSSFARAIIRHLLKDPAMDVPSPTFTLVQSYGAQSCGVQSNERPSEFDSAAGDCQTRESHHNSPKKTCPPEIWHSDLYRLEDPEELAELGFEEALDRVALLVEWPDRLAVAQQKKALSIVFKHQDGLDDKRLISVHGQQDWIERLDQQLKMLVMPLKA